MRFFFFFLFFWWQVMRFLIARYFISLYVLVQQITMSKGGDNFMFKEACMKKRVLVIIFS